MKPSKKPRSTPLVLKTRKFRLKHFINYIVIGVLLMIFTVMSFTSGMRSSTQYLLEKVGIAMILAVSLSMVVGFLGELSLGHAGFMCIGAYIGGKISVLLSGSLGNSLPTLLIAVVAGGIVAAICGVVVGLPALRLRGDYLAIVTLAFGEIVKSLFMNSSAESFGGALGMETPRFDRNSLFIICFLLVLFTLMVVQNVIRSRHGRAITAIRDSEIAARATGINVTRYKLIVFAMSAFFAGIAGVLYSYSNQTVQSSKFGFNYSIEILVMVVLGGMGSINGSLIAASLITFLNVKLATVLTGNMAVLQNLIYALVLIVLVIFGNAPFLAGVREKYSFQALLNRIVYGGTDAAFRHDDEALWSRIPTKIDMDELLSMDAHPEENRAVRLDGDKPKKRG